MRLSCNCSLLIILCLYATWCHGHESLLVKTAKNVRLTKAVPKVHKTHVPPVHTGPINVRTPPKVPNPINHGTIDKPILHDKPKTPIITRPKTPPVDNTIPHVKPNPKIDHGPAHNHHITDKNAEVHASKVEERRFGKHDQVKIDPSQIDKSHHSNGNGHDKIHQPSPPIGNTDGVANSHTKKRVGQRSGPKEKKGNLINNKPSPPATESKGKGANHPNSNQPGHANDGQSPSGHKATGDTPVNSPSSASQPGGASVGDVNAFNDFANNNNNNNNHHNVNNSSVIQPAMLSNTPET